MSLGFSQPEVSIVICSYNTEDYIAHAIQSALGQTYENIEVIVVDNASTDQTVAIAQRIAEQTGDQRLRIVQNPQNKGASYSRNRGTQVARGKWVAVLDSDDWYAPDRIATLLAVAAEEGADIIADDLHLIQDGESAPWSTLIQESGTTIKQARRIDPVYFVETDVYRKQCLHLGLTKTMIKREFLLRHQINYDESLNVVFDFWFALDCLLHGARFILLPEPYYYYRSRSSSLVASQSQIRHLEQSCRVSRQFLAKPSVQNNPELVYALRRNEAVFEQYKAYFSVVEPLKQGRWFTALQQMTRHPYFFVHFATQIPGILDRRFQYYVLGNKTIYGMLPRRVNASLNINPIGETPKSVEASLSMQDI